jgi:hypothetical protein
LSSGQISSYSLIEQETEDTLTITTYIKNGGWLKRKVKSQQTIEGTIFLISNESLQELVTKFKDSKRSCLIKQSDDGLVFCIFQGYTEDEPNIFDSILIKQYHGGLNEFGPPVFNTINTAKLSDDKLSTILSRLRSYGDFATVSRPVLILGDRDDQSISFYTNQNEARNFIVKISTEAEIVEGFSILINGQDLDSILCIFDKTDLPSETSLSIDNESNTLTISNTLGSITINLLDKGTNAFCEKWHDYFDVNLEEIYSHRVVDLIRFKEALLAQEPGKLVNNKSLKISTENLSLIITKEADPLGTDYSFVNILDINSLDQPWEPLAFNANGLKKTVDIISKGKLEDEKEQAQLHLAVFKRDSKINTRLVTKWLTSFKSKGLDDSTIYTYVSTIANPVS